MYLTYLHMFVTDIACLENYLYIIFNMDGVVLCVMQYTHALMGTYLYLL